MRVVYHFNQIEKCLSIDWFCLYREKEIVVTLKNVSKTLSGPETKTRNVKREQNAPYYLFYVYLFFCFYRNSI